MLDGYKTGPDEAQVQPVLGLSCPMCPDGPSLRTGTLRTGTVFYGRSRQWFGRARMLISGRQSRWSLRAALSGVQAPFSPSSPVRAWRAPRFLPQTSCERRSGPLWSVRMASHGVKGRLDLGTRQTAARCVTPMLCWSAAHPTTVAERQPLSTCSSPLVPELWAAGLPSGLHQLPNQSSAVRPASGGPLGGRSRQSALPGHATRPYGLTLGFELGLKCVRGLGEVRMSRIGTVPPSFRVGRGPKYTLQI